MQHQSQIYRISIDAMGGDHGLPVTVPATVAALKKNPHLHITLVGDQAQIAAALKKTKGKYPADRLDIHHTSQVVEMDESPALAMRNKKDSSMRVAINLVKTGQVNACVSAGNTGALMAIAKFVLKTLPEIDRPAIVYAIPSYDRTTKTMQSVYQLDLGANVNCSSEQLFQFGLMGSILASHIQNKKAPRVSLLNIGEEEMKGLDNIRHAAELLKKCQLINYTGYVEGNDIFTACTDVIVCDGFVGNATLKTMEGTAKLVGDIMSHSFKRNWFAKLTMLAAAPTLRHIKKRLNTDQYNGASLLGLKGTVVKSHGSAGANAFQTAIESAIDEIKHDIPNKIQANIETILHAT